MEATLTWPLQAVNAGFDELCKAGTAQLGTGASISLAARIEEALKAPGAAEALPSLNGARADTLPAGAVVRFQGMVMDMRDPEYYGGVYEEVHPDGSVHLRTGKFRDAFDVPAGCSIRPRNEFTWQRSPIVCAPLPGQTAWAAAAIAGPAAAAAAAAASAAPARSKRAAESDLAETAATEAAQDMDDDMAVEETKRPRAVGGTAPADPSVCAPCEGDVGAGAASAWTRSAALGSVMVKIYDPHSDSSEEGSDLRLNELIEVYGVLDLGGDTDVSEGGASDGISMMVEEERALRPPPSAQPRLHCLYYRKLQAAKSQPLLPAPDTYEETLAFQLARHHVAATRAAVVSALTSALSGDSLCAELLLLSIISRVIARRGEVPIGKLPLNITGCPAGAAGGGPSPVFASLGAVLRELLPCVSEMPLSVERLNGARLIPEKDYEANILMQGELQLPAGATLLLDETSIAPGKLGEKGVKNLAALGDLVSRQKVAFDFKYFPVDFEADVALISFSAANSVLSSTSQLCRVPLSVDPAGAPMPAALADPAFLQAARSYLGLAARCTALEMPEAVAAVLQDDFVSARKASRDVSADDFAHWLTCSRLHAASLLATQMDESHYTYVKNLEAARVARLKPAEVCV